jgi:hypothetical protein
MLTTLSVREILNHSARTRLPKSYTDKQKMEVVDNVITLLKLNHLENSVIGDASERCLRYCYPEVSFTEKWWREKACKYWNRASCRAKYIIFGRTYKRSGFLNFSGNHEIFAPHCLQRSNCNNGYPSTEVNVFRYDSYCKIRNYTKV